MATFFSDIWESVFTPGTNSSLLIATNVTFACLQVVLACLLYATASIHFVVLSVLCAGLWWSINWFAQEMKAVQQQQQQQQEAEEAEKNLDEATVTSRTVQVASDSETEVEETVPVVLGSRGTKREEPLTRSNQVEALQEKGELTKRAAVQASPSGSRSGVSTEDEWEKVSENEKER